MGAKRQQVDCASAPIRGRGPIATVAATSAMDLDKRALSPEADPLEWSVGNAVVGQIACTFRRRGRHSQWHDKVSGARQVSGYFGKLSNSADVVESVDTQDLKS